MRRGWQKRLIWWYCLIVALLWLISSLNDFCLHGTLANVCRFCFLWLSVYKMHTCTWSEPAQAGCDGILYRCCWQKRGRGFMLSCKLPCVMHIMYLIPHPSMVSDNTRLCWLPFSPLSLPFPLKKEKKSWLYHVGTAGFFFCMNCQLNLTFWFLKKLGIKALWISVRSHFVAFFTNFCAKQFLLYRIFCIVSRMWYLLQLL